VRSSGKGARAYLGALDRARGGGSHIVLCRGLAPKPGYRNRVRHRRGARASLRRAVASIVPVPHRSLTAEAPPPSSPRRPPRATPLAFLAFPAPLRESATRGTHRAAPSSRAAAPAAAPAATATAPALAPALAPAPAAALRGARATGARSILRLLCRLALRRRRRWLARLRHLLLAPEAPPMVDRSSP
jgi:hypothetical protein